MTRRNRLADLLRFYGNRPHERLADRNEDEPEWIGEERDWLDADAMDDDEDGGRRASLPPARTFGPGARPLTWKEHLGVVRHAMESASGDAVPHWPPGRELLYVVDPTVSISHNGLIIEVHCRDPRKRGGFTLPR